jgi:hypothetical protein
MRETIRAVMRFAGPRMLSAHPRLALWHIWDTWRYQPKTVRPEINEGEQQ